eukprot:3827389-Prorocentrum_lima.AAC.1
MTSSLVGSEMCIRDSPWAMGRTSKTLLEIPHRYHWTHTSAFASWSETVSYTHLTLPTICSV